MFLYMIFSSSHSIVLQKAKRSYEKDISAFKDARVSNANAFVAQEDDQGTVNAEEGKKFSFSTNSWQPRHSLITPNAQALRTYI